MSKQTFVDTGTAVALAGIAAAGSFEHIKDTAASNGQPGWISVAIAVCIDLGVVYGVRERQRDIRTGRERTGRMSAPTALIIGCILLSIGANLAQADPTMGGWILAAVPAGIFMAVVGLLERRASGPPEPNRAVETVPERVPLRTWAMPERLWFPVPKQLEAPVPEHRADAVPEHRADAVPEHRADAVPIAVPARRAKRSGTAKQNGAPARSDDELFRAAVLAYGQASAVPGVGTLCTEYGIGTGRAKRVQAMLRDRAV